MPMGRVWCRLWWPWWKVHFFCTRDFDSPAPKYTKNGCMPCQRYLEQLTNFPPGSGGGRGRGAVCYASDVLPCLPTSSCSHILQFRALIFIFDALFVTFGYRWILRALDKGQGGHKVIKISKNNYRYIISRFSRIILVYYCKCCNLIGYSSRYLFLDR